MRLHKTGHAIADTVSDLIGELPDGDYKAAYGILRHSIFGAQQNDRWFEFDKGFYGASHYSGNYRLSYKSTQPIYDPNAPREEHGLTLEPWQTSGEWTMICPPTAHVGEFFNIDYASWLFEALNTCKKFPELYMIRTKDAVNPIDWSRVRRVVTFNSTVGFEALRRGIEVISNPTHSTIGSYTQQIGATSCYDRNPLLEFAQAHQFKLAEKEKIECLIQYYLSISGTTAAKQ